MLVIGGNGLIGTHIKAALNAKGELVEETRRESTGRNVISLDLMHAEAFDPSICQSKKAIFCAAATNMMWCEENPVESRAINVDGTIHILRKLADNGFSGVFLSSSQVFDGEDDLCDEDSTVNCKNLYGQQKLDVETYITDKKLPFAILRPSKIMGTGGLGIFHKWIQLLRDEQPIKAATNISLSPVLATDVAEIALKLTKDELTGIWHLSAPDQMSYAEAVIHMAKTCKYDINLITQSPVSEVEVSSKFLARFTALDCRKLRKKIGYSAPPSRTVLERLFQGASL